MMPIEFVPYLVLSFIVGIAIGYLLTRRTKARVRELESELASYRQQLESVNKRLSLIDAENSRLNNVIRALESDRARLGEKADQIPKLEKTIDARERTLEAADKTRIELLAENAKLHATLEAEQNKFEQLQLARKELANQFEKISNDVLTSNRESFLSLAEQKLGQYQQLAKGDLEKRQQAIDELITPLRTKIKDFELKVDEVYRTEAAERNSLRGEIKNLVELNQQISKEASNLVLALKGDTKKQGNWGELICEKVLEFSGLRKGIEYKIQESHQDDDGRRRQPDVIVYLPDNKHIIIDSKVSLVAYDRYISAETDDERSTALLEHITSVKRHVKELSDKDYSSLPTLDSPDFTLLFMPIESSFGLAIQADNELFAYAWDRKIIIVSPSTLLATLRTISSIWKQERQTKNALDIADRAGKMYDKFVGFIEDLIAVGKKMGEAKGSYDDAMKKLSSGSGNLVRQSEQLKDMGAKATKQLPAQLLDRAVDIQAAEIVAAGPEEGRLL
ncbi:MAG TPA: DNA recombination protein RmuC [Candidatus Kapabacteria bacterium]|jgi:DNA recombination protein RmuC|nr:DNA recombination protein RmuC [Candidatus Kapabacteria bacterium]